MAVVLSSSEMPELIDLSDRVLVLCESRVNGELRGSEITEEAILELAAPGMEHLFGSGHVH
jgi:ABC-type sugar transport system ATPase subunit